LRTWGATTTRTIILRRRDAGHAASAARQGGRCGTSGNHRMKVPAGGAFFFDGGRGRPLTRDAAGATRPHKPVARMLPAAGRTGAGFLRLGRGVASFRAAFAQHGAHSGGAARPRLILVARRRMTSAVSVTHLTPKPCHLSGGRSDIGHRRPVGATLAAADSPGAKAGKRA
jgi:hypothetical protein